MIAFLKRSPIPCLWAIPFVVASPFLVMGALQFANRFGSQIATENLAEDYGLGVLWAVFLAVSIAVFPSRFRRDLLVLWLFRCFVTLGLMLVYEDYYGLDAFNYFREGKTYDVGTASGNSGMSGSNAMFFAVGLMKEYIPFLNSYHAIKVLFSFVGLLGVYAFFLALNLQFGPLKRSLLYLVGLFPSVLFWGSILGKDPVILCGICLSFLGTVLFLQRRLITGWMCFSVGVAMASAMRVWLLPILLLPTLFVVMFALRSWIHRTLIAGVLGTAFVFNFQYLLDKFKLQAFEDILSRANSLTQAWSGTGGSGQVIAKFGSTSEMLLYLPYGMFSALFRPLPGEVMNPFGIVAGLENLFLLVVFGSAAIQLFKKREFTPILIWLSLALIIWAAMYAFISPQNLGTGYRFRLQAAPFLIGIIFIAFKGRWTLAPTDAEPPRQS